MSLQPEVATEHSDLAKSVLVAPFEPTEHVLGDTLLGDTLSDLTPEWLRDDGPFEEYSAELQNLSEQDRIRVQMVGALGRLLAPVEPDDRPAKFREIMATQPLLPPSNPASSLYESANIFANVLSELRIASREMLGEVSDVVDFDSEKQYELLKQFAVPLSESNELRVSLRVMATLAEAEARASGEHHVLGSIQCNLAAGAYDELVIRDVVQFIRANGSSGNKQYAVIQGIVAEYDRNPLPTGESLPLYLRTNHLALFMKARKRLEKEVAFFVDSTIDDLRGWEYLTPPGGDSRRLQKSIMAYNKLTQASLRLGMLGIADKPVNETILPPNLPRQRRNTVAVKEPLPQSEAAELALTPKRLVFADKQGNSYGREAPEFQKRVTRFLTKNRVGPNDKDRLNQVLDTFINQINTNNTEGISKLKDSTLSLGQEKYPAVWQYKPKATSELPGHELIDNRIRIWFVRRANEVGIVAFVDRKEHTAVARGLGIATMHPD